MVHSMICMSGQPGESILWELNMFNYKPSLSVLQSLEKQNMAHLRWLMGTVFYLFIGYRLSCKNFAKLPKKSIESLRFLGKTS